MDKGNRITISAKILLILVWLYKKIISPWMTPCCRFTPTCSSYAQEALKKHGAFKGIILSTWRILRCNPLCHAGFDPVPDRLSHEKNQKIGICNGCAEKGMSL